MDKAYAAIDLKSFYASVECLDRGLDPLTTHLIVADNSRTDKTICLAVSPALKALGIPGRPRLFEVKEKIAEINRNLDSPITFITAPPQMAHYIDYSKRVFQVYLKYVSAEDIHTYSIDEVFMDLTPYLKHYNESPKALVERILTDLYFTTGLTATAGIGTNLYLSKIAMDIDAKHMEADRHGMRISVLDEYTYRHKLWDHQPITDFWRIGRGYQKRLSELGIFTMGDVALCSLGSPSDYLNEDLLYNTFGKNAELLIDHAWGWEPCTIKDIKSYRPSSSGVVSSQVLHTPYTYSKARLVAREMADMLSMDLFSKRLLTNQLMLTIGYDKDNLLDKNIKNSFKGEIVMDRYGRRIPKHAHGTLNLTNYSSSSEAIIEAISTLFDKHVDTSLLIRRITIAANNLYLEGTEPKEESYEQLDLFSSAPSKDQNNKLKERRRQSAILSIKKKYGKNAVLRGMNYEDGATAKDRNSQIGGHKA